MMVAFEENRLDLEVSAVSNGGDGGGALEMGTIEDGVRLLLKGLGEDPEREGLRKTPMRVAKAFREGMIGYRQRVKDIVQDALFPEAGFENGAGQAGGAGGLVVVRDIDLFSYCESCLLPFSIQCHIGYVPSGKRVVGLSKLSRVADVYAKRLQEPKRLADEICSALQNSIAPAGVSVALQCWHIQFPEALKCNPCPKHPSVSAMQGWARTSVCSSSGVFTEKNATLCDEFHGLLKLNGVNLDSINARSGLIQTWCPSKSFDINTRSPSIPVVSAAASILRSLGDNPSRKELIGTPHRYANWLMNFRRLKQNGFNLNSIDLHENLNGYNQCVGEEIHSELNLPFCAQCEHHLLPFHGVVHIGFFHAKQRSVAIDRSLLQSVVHCHGCKLQVQERLTREIAEAVFSVVGRGVMVVVEASHICMISRGIEKIGSSTATMAVMGKFSTDPAAKKLFLETISTSTATGG